MLNNETTFVRLLLQTRFKSMTIKTLFITTKYCKETIIKYFPESGEHPGESSGIPSGPHSLGWETLA